ncbi:DinB family protein [Bacillus sp. CECT 9360]|uniref:DinB family protein n=1 Tax=Bacillus sp. CECT 9360 TaxID=2845821 RepID=UPI001E5AB24F|nr:DinB family protein [Bacillus sp. CECT 9360]CAH0343985.1 putative protein YjoA [Bacillus sp. CECT 9360]
MNSIELILLNFEENRRRSIKVWNQIPTDKWSWKPDQEAMTCYEMIIHLLSGEYAYCHIVNNGGSLENFLDPYETREFSNMEELFAFSVPYRQEFINTIKSFSEEDLQNIKIDRSYLESGYIRQLGDMLLRIAYHESVHTGQLLDYMRTMGVERPHIWD